MNDTTVRTLSDHGLTLPEALMPFLHNATGQPYHPARSASLAAAAELSELVALGHARTVDDTVAIESAVEPTRAERGWIAELTAAHAGTTTPVREWVRGRAQALAVQQESAVQRGLLTRSRGRLLGLGYDRLSVDVDARRGLVADVIATPQDARSLALAHLLVRSGLHHRNDLDADERRALADLAERAQDVPDAGPDAMTVALATVALTTVLVG